LRWGSGNPDLEKSFAAEVIKLAPDILLAVTYLQVVTTESNWPGPSERLLEGNLISLRHQKSAIRVPLAFWWSDSNVHRDPNQGD
jgi:hypothetical protein